MWNFFKNRLGLVIAFLVLLSISCQNRNLHTSQSGDYIISNENELKEFAESVNKGNSFEGKTVVLANDVALTEIWMPIGDSTNGFKGIFDGGGYTISGLYVDSVVSAGLFGSVLENGQIKNINVIAKKIKGKVYSGGLAGYYSSSKPIENSSVKTDSIIAISDLNLTFSGGLVGFNYANKLTIYNCHVNGNILAFSSDDISVSGGLVGYSNSSISISNSYFNGDALTFGKFSASGGLVGKLHGTINISNSYAIGELLAFSPEMSVSGGLLGSIDGVFSISNSYSNLDIYSFDANAVSASAGLVGLFADKFNVSNSYAGGSVKAQLTGGIFGHFFSLGEISSVYYNLEGAGEAYAYISRESDKDSSMRILGLNPEDFKKQESFKGWDFENIWKIDSEINDGYPYLRWSEKIIQEFEKTKEQTKNVNRFSGVINKFNPFLFKKYHDLHDIDELLSD